jgi:hypothetical protein
MDINDKVDTDPHGGVMVSVLASSAVDHGFDPYWVKPYTIN